MELRLPSATLQIADLSTMRGFRHKSNNVFQENNYSSFVLKLKQLASKLFKLSSALPETAASVAVAATIVGAAATLLVKRTESSRKPETLTKVCDDCGGSGICSECNGEGFVLKTIRRKCRESKNDGKEYGYKIYSRASQKVELLHKMLFWPIL